MTRGTGTRRSIDPVLSLKTEMLLRLVENNDVTIKLLRAEGENPLCYFCQNTSCCIILIKQRCTQFSFLRPCKTICAQKREERGAGLSAASRQEDLWWESLMVGRVPDPSRTSNEQISLKHSKTLLDGFSLQDYLVVAFFFSPSNLWYLHQKTATA